MNSIVALPIVAATPTTAPEMLSVADPIFAALDAGGASKSSSTSCARSILSREQLRRWTI
ncbi:hypothetical protein [Bradyrhizobium sp. Rc3b]|uniref:hypothetical protein n=1 Tax=Bradyrhizobium sp. Rc3b TaxID=1855322 RepID=UPI0011605A82|nr:hypothetical protein [Bradyrhizobium sp. Rc3b]